MMIKERDRGIDHQIEKEFICLKKKEKDLMKEKKERRKEGEG